MMLKCPLCGGKVLYEGATMLECDGRECSNRSPTAALSTDEMTELLERIRSIRKEFGGYSWFP